MDRPAPYGNRDARRTAKTARLIRSLLAVLLMILALYGFLKITDVQITGNVVYSQEEVLAASGLRVGSPLLLTRGRAVKRAVEAALPAVEDARVVLQLPGTVQLIIREGTGVAVLQMEDGRYILLSARGKVVGETDDPSPFVLLKGFQPREAGVGKQLVLETVDEEKLACVTELLTLLEEQDRIQEVRELDVSNLTSIRMNYADRFLVRLGGADRLKEKLGFMEHILEELTYGETGTIDLTRETEGHYIPR